MRGKYSNDAPSGMYRGGGDGKLHVARSAFSRKPGPCPCDCLHTDYDNLIKKASIFYNGVFKTVWKVEIPVSCSTEDVERIGPLFILYRYRDEQGKFPNRIKETRAEAEAFAKGILKEIVAYSVLQRDSKEQQEGYRAIIEKTLRCTKCGEIGDIYWWLKKPFPQRYERWRKNYYYIFYPHKTEVEDRV